MATAKTTTKATSKARAKADFKNSISTYRSIISDINNRKYSSVYLLMGDEPFFIDKVCDAIATTVVDQADREFSQSIFYGKESNVADVMAALQSYPMLSEKNVVIIKEAQALKGLDQLQHYFKSPLESTMLVICYKNGTLDKRSVLYKKIVASGVILDSVTARDYEVGGWISELIKGHGLDIEPSALSMLIDFLGTSLTKIDNEIEKLTNRLDLSIKVITPLHIEENIGISKDFNNFELTKAFSMCDKRRALLIATHFAQNPKDNPLVVTMSALFNHFQRIFSLGLLTWEAQKRRKPMPTDNELIKILKLTNVFFLREYKDAVKAYPSSRSFKILELIRIHDAKSKGIDAGSGGDSANLKELILKIFAVK